ncbi:MAG: hypothetical protein ACI9XO_000757 [Paraglaciecola sp.]|jgi:hypothetical protein
MRVGRIFSKEIFLIFVKFTQESLEAEEMTVLGKLLGLRLLFLFFFVILTDVCHSGRSRRI